MTESLLLTQPAKQMPNSIQLEFTILGCVVFDNNLIDRMPLLGPEHFYSQQHADIYAAMLALRQDGEPITPFTVRIDEDSPVVQQAGGVARYLGSALAACHACSNPAQEARLLIDLAQKRKFIMECRRFMDAACEEDDQASAEEHSALLNASLESLLRGGQGEFMSNLAVTDAILADLKDHRQAFSTGIPKLDMAMGGGMYPGRSYGFAAKKKVGKTILAATISCNLNTEGVKHLFIAAEMSAKEIHQRNICRLIDAFPSDFRKDQSANLDFQGRISRSRAESKGCTLYHNAPGLTFAELKRIASAAVYQHRVKGIILDYWQLVGGKEARKNTSEHLDEVAQWLADFGRKHGVWMLVMAQINQSGNTRGGEGIRLAFDQVYQIRGMAVPQGEEMVEDLSIPRRWLEMMDTRYTAWADVGSENNPGLYLNEKGPFFEPQEEA